MVMKCTAQGVQSVNIYYVYMVTYSNQTHPGDHFEIHRNIKSLCCMIGTNIVLQVNYTSKKKNTQKKRTDLWLPEVGVGGEATG